MPSATASMTKSSLWLANSRYDLGFFVLSGFITALLVIPYRMYGTAAILPIYIMHVVLFSLPHHALTYMATFPKSVSKSIRIRSVFASCGLAAAMCALIPLTRGTRFNDSLLTVITMIALWHLYRQNFGITKAYDGVQIQRTGDVTLGTATKPLYWFLALMSAGVILWAFMQQPLKYVLSDYEHYELVHPTVPLWFFRIYLAVTMSVALLALKRCVWDRKQQGKFIPWPQLALIGTATAVYCGPFLFIPVTAFPLFAAIISIHHIIQYFAFVWLFERQRSALMAGEQAALQFPQRLASSGNATWYFGLAFFYSAVVMGIYLVLPSDVGLAMLYLSNVAHYFVDGLIWRRGFNATLSPTFKALAKRQVFEDASSWNTFGAERSRA